MLRSFSLAILLAITGCAVPRTDLTNTAGQSVHCGGDNDGFKYGLIIGFNIESDNARRCVKAYQAEGFRTVSVTE